MKTTYTCDICGNSSEDKGTIEGCEAQGAKHEHEKGQIVQFLFAPRGARQWVRAWVQEIEFGKGTHRPTYNLVPMEDLIIDGNLISEKGVMHCHISEENIHPNPVEVGSTI